MTVKYIAIAILAFCLSNQTASAQKDNAEVDVTIFESVLSTAKWANFKYEADVAAAKKGDHKAATRLLDFSGTVDGRAALDHSVTLLELIASDGDNTFAGALFLGKPKLRAVILDRLQLAQGRTKKEALRKPMSEWAPNTWDVLHGKPYAPRNSDINISPEADPTIAKKQQQSKRNDSFVPAGAAVQPQAAPAPKEKGKQ